MKIKIEYTLEVNAEEWANEYGIEKSEVRQDVRDYFKSEDMIPSHLMDFVNII